MLKIQRVSKNFQEPVLQDINAELRSGQGFVLQAPNGSGKSTLLRLISGLLTPDSGEIFWRERPTYQQKVKMAFCSSNASGFYQRLSIRENFYYFGSLYGLSKKKVDIFIHSNKIFDIDYWSLAPEKISDGMHQKIKILRAFMHAPELMLFDEPLNYLDSKSSEKFLSYLREWVKQDSSRCYIFSQHTGNFQESCLRIESHKLVQQ